MTGYILQPKHLAAAKMRHVPLAVIPPTVDYIACDVFPSYCQLSVLSYHLCPELEQWCARSYRDSTIVFRRILQLNSDLPS
jgi:hypothetical protein